MKNLYLYKNGSKSLILVSIALACMTVLVFATPAHAQHQAGSGSENAGEQGTGGSTNDSGNPEAGGSSNGDNTMEGGNPEAGAGGNEDAGTGGNDSSGEGNPGAGTGNSGNGGEGGQGEGGESEFSNNLSFPVIAADGFGIAPINEQTFTQIYTGPYTDLSEEQLNQLEGHDWYAQKTEGNVWQADYAVATSGEAVDVFGVDWGDIVEAVHPIIGNPFRLELTLYQSLDEAMDGYTMELLANPSSLDEVQGTNQQQYESDLASVVTSQSNMAIQFLGDGAGTDLEWTGSEWTRDGVSLPHTDMDFGPELNVGGKYIYGGSKGGWSPDQEGVYRITFYLENSDINLADAVVGNYADWSGEATDEEAEEPRAATPMIDAANNISYADVLVVDKREGTPPEEPGDHDGEEEDSEEGDTIEDSFSFNTVDIDAVEQRLDEAESATAACQPYLTDHLSMGRNNDPEQVVLLQEFLNDELGLNIPTTGYFGPITHDAVKTFQELNSDKILKPWVDAGHTDMSLTRGTGIVFYTTLATINEMQCS